ncbi:hypothetical protein ID853_13515 [Xenorhabdus sp. Vera]|uniref:hypothetical protein n=1 Tax=Xenorhabdus koppenhoeferi TaxID=351659 RepID=UPI0019BF3840|nr:hypothetical protein [Xenorhabdus sp. Vera]MBD2811878.1 hypothetical protein [Xenorhabdus sp. Vera]
MAKIIYGGAFGIKYNHLLNSQNSDYVTLCGISHEYVPNGKIKTGKITCPYCIEIAAVVFESCSSDELESENNDSHR